MPSRQTLIISAKSGRVWAALVAADDVVPLFVAIRDGGDDDWVPFITNGPATNTGNVVTVRASSVEAVEGLTEAQLTAAKRET